jgi:hypothetical protein
MEQYPTANREDDLAFAEALRFTESVHVPSEEHPDRNRKYGPCLGCGELWPCRVWNVVARSATDWLNLASAEVIRRSNEVWERIKTSAPHEECIGCSRGWYGHQDRNREPRV